MARVRVGNGVAVALTIALVGLGAGPLFGQDGSEGERPGGTCGADYCVEDAGELASALEDSAGRAGDRLRVEIAADIDLAGEGIAFEGPAGLKIRSAAGERYALASGVIYIATGRPVSVTSLELKDVSVTVEETERLTVRDAAFSATGAFPGEGVITFTGERLDVVESEFTDVDLRGTNGSWAIGAVREGEEQEIYLIDLRFERVSLDEGEEAPLGIVFGDSGYLHVEGTRFGENTLRAESDGHALPLILHGGRVVLSGGVVFEGNRVAAMGTPSLAALILAQGDLEVRGVEFRRNGVSVARGAEGRHSIGSIAVAGGDLTVEGSLFAGNSLKRVPGDAERVERPGVISLRGEMEIDEESEFRGNEPRFAEGSR